ncbi:MAG: SDR family NAD(P)-dependent oxidoreductase [Myxococcota bacterium]|nr:SDR family NAD(P)-dependent oxidoreductase [Myxococcota bacterium]
MSGSQRVVFITGGGSGMGRLAARNLAGEGARVAALDVDQAGLDETAAGHDGIHTYPLDVTHADAVEAAAKQVESDLGPIDRVYNAAAIMPLGKLVEQESEVIHRIMDINYGGVVNVTKATLPGMLERGRGDLINFASMAGWLPILLMGAYNASKAAVVSFTEVLHHENRGSGVRIACVCPPPVATPLLDQGRETAWPKVLDGAPPIEPQEVLDAIEKALEGGELFVFPGRGTSLSWRMRRFFPDLVWSMVHRTEGW